MPLHRPSELKEFLDTLGIYPKKSLSQNFLLDGNIIKKILAIAELNPGDPILEIGPGPGVLTEAMLNAGAIVTAVEKDSLLAKALNRLDPSGQHLDVHCMDVMDFSIPTHLSPNHLTKVIANLPYHLTTPILIELVNHSTYFSHIVVMVQDEVAKRFTADPGTKLYGSISVFLQFYTQPEYCFKVSRNCFYPKPNVDSAIVKLTLKRPPDGVDPGLFFNMTRTAFNQRRKMLQTTLQAIYPKEHIHQALISLNMPISCRPEELSLKQFILLFNFLNTL